MTHALKLKANLFAVDGFALGEAITAMVDQIGQGSKQGYVEDYPSYGGSWSIETDQIKYTDDDLDDLSKIPFGR
jgi:hypothetical protein